LKIDIARLLLRGNLTNSLLSRPVPHIAVRVTDVQFVPQDESERHKR